MHAAGHPAEQALRGIGCLGDKGIHIVSAGEVQVAPQFAVKRVFHRHIDHHASLIHHRVKLGTHFIGCPVHTGQDAGVAAGGRVELIPARGGLDFGPACPQKGYIPHHDLAADPQLCGQCTGTDGCAGPMELLQDLFPALCCVHCCSPCQHFSLL